MLSRNDSGVYTKNEAYSLIKTKLGVPKKALIFEDFFKLFFYRTGDGLYIPLMDDNQISVFFEENKIPEVNKRIFIVKQQKPILAQKLYSNAMFSLKKQLSLP